jgi:maltose alpha-D-glucosyltransferase/alpha-amylase
MTSSRLYNTHHTQLSTIEEIMKRKSPGWLEKAVFYEIYPQSFLDTNGDGIGDLPGIIQKLDYIASLGVNGLWINPCFASPFGDAGYDVSDYYAVAPRYGSNADLEQLFLEAHQRGIRVLLDLVPGHTSIEHPWFKESCKPERNPYSDWFIWSDSGWSAPLPNLNNVRGYADRDGAFYVNFFYMQPALNYGFATPDPQFPWQQSVDAPGPKAVRQEMKNVMKYWLDKGADGFRVDMAMSLVKNDPDKKATSAFWQEVREWLDAEYPEAAIVSEWSNPQQALLAGFHMDFYLHFGLTGSASLFRKQFAGAHQGGDRYGFSFFERQGHGNIRAFLDEFQVQYQNTRDYGFISFVSGNHDMHPRFSTNRDVDELEVGFLFLLTMPGVPFIYYGDEIGMRSVNGLHSKEGAFQRTSVRTPMQWDTSANAGFSAAASEKLYLPVDSSPDRPDVATQEPVPNSLLNRFRRLVALRKNHPVLGASGDFEAVYAEAGKYPFVYLRQFGKQKALVALNPSGVAVEAKLPAGLITAESQHIYGVDLAISQQDGNNWIHMPAVSGAVYLL